MAVKKEEVKKGFRKVETKANFFKFENAGDEFHGFFLEASERESKKFGNTQTIWNCADMDGVITQISEKTTMQTFRLNLKKGDEFILIYKGEVKTEGGKKPYKDFEFFIKE